MTTLLTLERGAGQTVTVAVTQNGAVLNLTGWSVSIAEAPAALAGLVAASLLSAAGGTITVRITHGVPSSGQGQYRFWLLLTPPGASPSLDRIAFPFALRAA